MNQENVILHIGMGKTATKVLQNDFFPLISKKLNIDYWSEYSNKNRLNTEQISLIKKFKKMRKDYKNNILSLNDICELNFNKIFISWEVLVGVSWNPFYYEKFADFNRKIFSSDTHIIITIRNPKDFLTSLYIQQLQMGNIVNVKDFFINNKSYERNYDSNKYHEFNCWNLELFSYENLINIYKKRFKKVTIIKYENYKNNLRYFENIFPINNIDYNKLSSKFNKKILNRSYSIKAIKLTFLFNKFLKFFKSNIKNYENFIFNLHIINKNLFCKLWNRIIIEFSWKFFIQNRFDKIFKYNRFSINFSLFDFIDIDNLEKKYKNLPNFKTYTQDTDK